MHAHVECFYIHLSLYIQSLLECCIVRGVKLTLNRSSQNSFDHIEFPIAGSQPPQLHPLLQVHRNSSKQPRAFVKIVCRIDTVVYFTIFSAVLLNFVKCGGFVAVFMKCIWTPLLMQVQHYGAVMWQCMQSNNLWILCGSIRVVDGLLQVCANRLLVAVKTDYHDLTLIRPLVYLLSSRHLLPSPISIDNEVAESVLALSLYSFTHSEDDHLALRLSLDCCSLVRLV